MRVLRKERIERTSFDDSKYYASCNVYSLPDGEETYNGDYADVAWSMYRRHCVRCPYKMPERSLQFTKV